MNMIAVIAMMMILENHYSNSNNDGISYNRYGNNNDEGIYKNDDYNDEDEWKPWQPACKCYANNFISRVKLIIINWFVYQFQCW